MSIVEVDHLTKHYRVADKQPGVLGSLRHFVRRRYRQVEAVQSISFAIEPGEIVGFLGPNGAGKTTVLKMISGLMYPTAGTVQVAGHTPVRREAAFLRAITLVMGQKQQLIWDLPALDSIRLNAAIYNVPPESYRQRLASLAGMLEIGGKLTTPVRKLSLGERMKAELIAALLHYPRVLFLDEPTLGLDVNAQASVREFLRSYCQETGATILLTSHYMADITALCQRVLVIHQGRLMYDGRLDAIVDRFAPYREVTVELGTARTARELSRYGEVRSLDGRIVRLIVVREELTGTVSRILADLDVIDLTIADPPVEGIIGRLFTEGGQAP